MKETHFEIFYLQIVVMDQDKIASKAIINKIYTIYIRINI